MIIWMTGDRGSGKAILAMDLLKSIGGIIICEESYNDHEVASVVKDLHSSNNNIIMFAETSYEDGQQKMSKSNLIRVHVERYLGEMDSGEDDYEISKDHDLPWSTMISIHFKENVDLIVKKLEEVKYCHSRS